MNEVDMMSPSKVAEMYGGDKRKIGQAVQMGLLDPTVGVMAGMFIDRVRSAAAKEMAPQTTVAQEVMAPAMAPPAIPAAGLAAAQAVPVERGLAALPVPEDAVPSEYAGGGIVAFQNEGFVDPIFSMDLGTGGGGGVDPSAFSEEEKLKYLQGRIGYPQAAALNEGKITLDKLFSDVYGRTSYLPEPKAQPKPREERPAAPATPPRRQAETRAEDQDVVDRRRDEAAQKPAEAQTDYATYIENLKKRFGVSDTPDATARAALQKYRERLDTDISKAGALGMIQAGLGIAGGKSRYALQNLAGAMPGISEYAKSLEGIRKEERGLIDAEAKLDEAANARRRGDMDTALRLEKEAKDLAIREQGLEIQRRQAAASERQASRMGAEAEVIDRYARAKGITFDQALAEIATAKGIGRDPFRAQIAEMVGGRLGKGQSNIDIKDLLSKYPDLAPTR